MKRNRLCAIWWNANTALKWEIISHAELCKQRICVVQCVAYESVTECVCVCMWVFLCGCVDLCVSAELTFEGSQVDFATFCAHNIAHLTGVDPNKGFRVITNLQFPCHRVWATQKQILLTTTQITGFILPLFLLNNERPVYVNVRSVHPKQICVCAECSLFETSCSCGSSSCSSYSRLVLDS